MIRISVKDSTIKLATKRIEDKVDQAKFAVSPISKTEIAKAAFTLTSKQFIKDIGLEAMKNPEMYHHLYEWDKIGSPTQKLFILQRAHVRDGHLVVNIETIKSNTYVPIREELRRPGKYGKRVTAKHIFKEKAAIMEAGKPVRISSNNIIAFYSEVDEQIVFVPAGKVIRVRNPGGKATKNALKKYSQLWYRTRPAEIIQASRLIGQIGNEVARTINKNRSSKTDVYNAIKKITSQYSNEISVI